MNFYETELYFKRYLSTIIRYKFLYKDEDNAFLFITFPHPNEILKNDIISFLKFLRKKYKNIHYFFIPYWYIEGVYQTSIIKEYCDSYVILANSLEEKNYYDKHLVNNFYCNQNCWVDYNVYTIKNIKKEYDFVYNANNSIFKNHNLIKNICKYYDILFITYDIPKIKNYKSEFETVNLNDYNPKKILRDIPDKKVALNLNKCQMGVFLSTTEGACYSASEYLLCGLPVISVRSNGGRDVWFNDKNSFIINNNENELKRSIDFILNNKDKYDPIEIRKTHIDKQILFRNIFSKYFQTVLDKSKLNLNADEIINENFSNKMLDVRTEKKENDTILTAAKIINSVLKPEVLT